MQKKLLTLSLLLAIFSGYAFCKTDQTAKQTVPEDLGQSHSVCMNNLLGFSFESELTTIPARYNLPKDHQSGTLQVTVSSPFFPILPFFNIHIIRTHSYLSLFLLHQRFLV